jgi:glycosyltransferase involved in cell wall biosynthesis
VSSQPVPLVSVVTPVYNGGQYLRECIESVIAQRYDNWCYTIVNNCSTDDTLEIAQHYASREPRIRVHNNAEFLPIIDNHNHAISLIDSDSAYCKPLMADDWLYPECLETMVRCALTQPSIGLVCCCASTGSNKILFDRLPPSDSGSPTTVLAGGIACRISLLEDRYFFGSPTTMLIRADLIRKRRPFYNPLNLHADEESCYDILQESDFAFVHQALAFIRVHEQSHTSSVHGLESMFACRVYALAKYGRVYLTDDEFQRRYRARLAEYYAKLAAAAVELRGKRFWEFHRTMLIQIGAPLDRSRLTGAIALHVARRLASPRSLVRNVFRRMMSVCKAGSRKPERSPPAEVSTSSVKRH